MKIALIIAAAFFSIVAFAWTFTYYTADVRGRIQANEQIKSGANRIAQYDHFFNLCAGVQTNEASLDAQNEQLAQATSDKEKERIRTNIAGLTTARAEGINQYNADARKNYTDGQFRDSDLPYQIPTTSYKGVRTSCGY